jgi:hypothetical protein
MAEWPIIAHVQKQTENLTRSIMHFSSILIGLAAFSTTIASSPSVKDGSVSPFEGLLRAGYRNAYLIDHKNYTALNEVMTQDVQYDSSNLGKYGGKSSNLTEVQASLNAAIGDAKV